MKEQIYPIGTLLYSMVRGLGMVIGYNANDGYKEYKIHYFTGRIENLCYADLNYYVKQFKEIGCGS